MKDFNQFLEHVMVNFAASYPYGLSKTEVVRLSFQAWCAAEAIRMNAAALAVEIPTVVAPN